jgi:hypothetical protein
MGELATEESRSQSAMVAKHSRKVLLCDRLRPVKVPLELDEKLHEQGFVLIP